MKINLSEVSIMVITHNLELAKPVSDGLLPLKSEVFYAPNYPSFSKVCNEAICKAEHEIVIICSYKARPKMNDVEHLVNILEDGFGFAAVHKFVFFGFRKDLINRIGFFDERFVNGGYEDCDFLRRIIEANIAFYETERLDFTPLPSTWNYGSSNSLSKLFFEKKWHHKNNTIKRCIEEEKYDYKLNCKNTNIVYKDRCASESFSNSTHEFCRTVVFL